MTKYSIYRIRGERCYQGNTFGVRKITPKVSPFKPSGTSFGASAVLIYGVPDAPLFQPRNVIFGHTLSAAAGVTTFMMFGLTWWSPGLGTALALVVMLLTKTTHPPGGATALFAVLTKAHPSYILTPILAGATILVIIGLLVNNLSPNRQYPRYWYAIPWVF